MPGRENKSIQEALAEGTQQLRRAGLETPRLDAEVLLAETTGRSRVDLIAHREDLLTPIQQDAYFARVKRRARGEPLAYILGFTWFYGLRLSITPDVLVPRAETEMIVERALDTLNTRRGRSRVVDVGTGSGAIAVAVSIHAPQVWLVATDISARALRLAQRNVRIHGLTDRVQLVQADLLVPLVGPFDLILANLPYVGTREAHRLDPRVKAFEPAEALWAGPDGLDLVRRLLKQAVSRLAPGGDVLLEIGYTQEETALQEARHFFAQSRIQVYKDLAGHPRVLHIST